MTRKKEPKPMDTSNALDTQPVPQLNTLPDCLPRWIYWGAMPTVQLNEAVALACNIDPQTLNPTGEFPEPDLELYQIRKESAARQFPATQYPDGIAIQAFAKWARYEMAGSEYWKDLPPEFQFPLRGHHDAPTLSNKERKTLLKLIFSLATTQNIDLSHPYKAGELIELITKEAGLPVSRRTIGDIINGAELRPKTNNAV